MITCMPLILQDNMQKLGFDVNDKLIDDMIREISVSLLQPVSPLKLRSMLSPDLCHLPALAGGWDVYG